MKRIVAKIEEFASHYMESVNDIIKLANKSGYQLSRGDAALIIEDYCDKNAVSCAMRPTKPYDFSLQDLLDYGEVVEDETMA